MLKPKITIEGFDRGLIPSPTEQVKNAFNMCSGIDIFKNPGILQISKKLDAMDEAASTDDITDTIKWMVKYSNDNKVYGLGNGRIYDYNNTVANKWSLVHTDANSGVGNGMLEFNGNLYWASNANLGQWTGAAWTDSHQAFTADDNAWHPMVIYRGKLTIGDGRYIATLDSSGTWKATALTLPDGYRVKTLEVYGDRLIIGTWRGTAVYDQSEATIFRWDGVDPTYEHALTIKEAGVHAMKVWRNMLIVFAGVKGNIYAYDGSALIKIAQIPDFGADTGRFAVVYPGAVGEYMGNLVFGFSAGTSSSDMAPYYGIYMLGQATPNGPIALVKSHNMSAGDQNDTVVGAILQAGTNVFWASFKYSTTYGVDKIDPGNILTSGVYFESQIYNLVPSHRKELVNGIEAVFNGTLHSSESFVIKYKLDGASSWSTLGTITSANQFDILRGIRARAKVIQVRGEPDGSTTNTPELIRVNIY